MKYIFLILAFLTAHIGINAQQKWDLQKCVEYAVENNISVRQSDLQTRFSQLTVDQNLLSRYPSLNLSPSGGFRLGRSENPTTGVLEDNNFLSAGFNLNSSVSLFNWFSKKNTIEANQLANEADKAAVKKVKDDIALNVAVAYLQILLMQEQAKISSIQIEETKFQLENTYKQVKAGSLPELNAAELEAQLARDNSALVTAEATVKQQILLMKALLNLDAASTFEIETPPVDRIPLDALADLQPESVFELALANLPQQKVNELRMLSAKKSMDAAKGFMYPNISMFGGLGSNYVNIKFPEFSQGPNKATGATVNVNGTNYNVVAPSFVLAGEKVIPFGRQMSNNFSQNIGVSMNIPIFNGGTARTNWKRSQLVVTQWELQKESDNQKLKQDIYKAYIDAVTSLEKFNANKKTVETAARVYDFSKKRYDVNLLSTFELINSQNNYQRSKIELLYAQFDHVFKMKLLEFYKGQGLKL
jgi:outer membrane protein